MKKFNTAQHFVAGPRFSTFRFDTPDRNGGVEGGAPAASSAAAIAAQKDTDIESRLAQARQEGAIKAREEEQAKLRSQLDREKEQRKQLQAQADGQATALKALQDENKQRELDGMKPSERMQAQLKDLEDRAARAEASVETTRREGEMRFRASELVTYRERVLRQYGEKIIPEMVAAGPDEASIDQSAANAHEFWNQKIGSLHTQYEAKIAEMASHQPAGVPAQPQNPALPAQPNPLANGFPTSANPQQVATASTPDLSSLTSEEAVRNGQYSGALREQVLNNLRGMQNPGAALGSLPRHMNVAQPPTVAMPNGVMQPQGFPTGPAAPQGQPQVQPQVAQPGIPPGPAPMPQMNDPMAQAQAAVARTHAGQNPTMGATPGAQGALASAQATGVNPQEAFAARFTPSAPVQ